MFTNAKKVASVAPAATKGKVAAKAVEPLFGLEDVAALDACAKAIKGLLDMRKSELKVSATENLIEKGLVRHSRPDTVHVSEGAFASGRMTVVKRSTASPLSQDELEVLAELLPCERDEDNNITAIPGFAETLESVPAMLAVNPAYAHDEELLKRIDKALSGVKGIPEDFIVSVASRAKVVVSETATDMVFSLPAKKAEQVFSIVANVTLGTVFNDVAKAWDIVKTLLVPDVKKELGKMLKASAKAA
jgi:hypothetical protein